MWVALPTGFYSAVQDRDDDRVIQVRSRSRADALALAHWLVDNGFVEFDEAYPNAESLVLKWPGRDYPFRILVWREQWAEFMYAQAIGVSWTNFKNEVKKRQGPRRAATYGRVWGVLLDIENEGKPPKPAKKVRQGNDGDDSLGDWIDQYIAQQDSRQLALMDTDERCPRCDRFLSDVGIDAEGDCRKCAAELDEAEAAGDMDLVAEITMELEMGWAER